MGKYILAIVTRIWQTGRFFNVTAPRLSFAPINPFSSVVITFHYNYWVVTFTYHTTQSVNTLNKLV